MSLFYGNEVLHFLFGSLILVCLLSLETSPKTFLGRGEVAFVGSWSRAGGGEQPLTMDPFGCGVGDFGDTQLQQQRVNWTLLPGHGRGAKGGTFLEFFAQRNSKN